MKDATKIFKRYENNPILHVKDFDGVAQIYNPSPMMYGDETILLVSVVEHAATKGYGRDVGQTRIARSTDGINFTLDDKNFIEVQKEGMPWDLYHHFIDNRITKIDDTYYIITPVMVKGFESPVGMLGKTKDFKTYERIEIITAPKNRGASLFPQKINGKYYKLDRPGGGDGSGGDIWISASEDLIHWGEFKPVLAAGYRFWNVEKIGPTPPMKTDKGWLVIIHGVFSPAGGTYYYLGAMLLDLDEPWKVIGKTNSYILAPEMDYEKHGNCDNTVFACGAIADYEKDQIRLYYGACDNYICLATGSLSELVDACIKEI
ncbi:glycoside hydrolase family 130 protein [Clostridium bowmanii]|uniref:glycoside hydrolase family 130 protein n=1 Tax=Clostridium bowmanii TaxID=132925 RepID=UPI001C0D55C1|nr:glycoside hydrolase family 130 protein [Clostridium bowmanii]MBU3190041.1 glycoside hydrolase family 130 protein [Clostridium bowmanii]MCA1074522.1 glycoside hydrolase family 130 protein [Clostridium bowmanii]